MLEIDPVCGMEVEPETAEFKTNIKAKSIFSALNRVLKVSRTIRKSI